MAEKTLVRWMKKLLGISTRVDRKGRSAGPHRRTRAPWRPTVDFLEERLAPANWVVTLTTPDSATTVGTLRYAYTQAAAGDTITFASSLNGATITLTSTLAIAKNINIIGQGASSVTISGGNAVEVISVAAGVTANITDVTITGGLAATGNGVKNAGTLTLSDDTISANGILSNTTNHYGAGIYSTGTLTINDCTITGNYSYTDGGGVYNTGTLTITDSTIQGNGAYTYGGGIYNSGTMSLAGDTISGNTGWDNTATLPEYGGGIYSSTTTTQMVDTIVSSNTAGTGGPDIYATIAAATNCLITNTTGYTLTTSTNNQLGVASGLGALATNGGPTKTMIPGTGSAALAHGAAVTTVPAAGIAATGNSITLTNGAFFGNVATGLGEVIIINSEQMLVTGVAGNVLTVVRGYNGTTAAAHTSGAGVYLSLDQRGYAMTPTTLATPDIGSYQTTGTAPGTPTVTSISPNAGPLAGGSSVTITGTNLANATRVSFGGIAGTIVSDSGIVIVATTPAEPAGTVDTIVTTAGWDASSAVAADQFTFRPPIDWVVSLATDSAAPSVGMLRYAINNSIGGDTITFAPALSGSTITLTSTLTIAHNLTIVGLPAAGADGPIINGAAAYSVFTINAGVTASISGLTITNGLAADGCGINNAGTLSLSDDSITGNGSFTNTTNSFGAGIYNTGTMTIYGCNISNNCSYSDGGGIANFGTMALSNSTVSGNGAWTDGGGIYNTGTIMLANDTIAGNVGYNTTQVNPTGDGIFSSTTTTQMVNCIVAGNDASSTDPDTDATFALANYNLIGNAAGFAVTSGTGNQSGVASGLGAIGAHGGPTNTMVPGTGSLAIAHGGAVTTVPAAGILATGNTITLTNGAFFGNVASGLQEVIIINSEQMLVTGVAGNVLTVVRGYNGTTAAAHSSGAGVYFSLDQRGYAMTPTTLATPDVGSYQTTGTAPGAPTVTGISPAAGPVAGGTSVTITGTNLANATGVSFGGVPGTIVSDSGTTIVATTPAVPAAITVDTTVTTAGWDTTATTPPDLFTYTPSTTATYSDYIINNNTLIIAREIVGNNDSLTVAVSGSNVVFTDTNGLLFDTPSGPGAASITGGGTSSITIPTSALNLANIEVALGTGVNTFNFTTLTSGTSNTSFVVYAGLAASDQIKFTGQTAINSATLTANSITETAAGSLITTNSLNTTSVTGTTLNLSSNIVGTTFTATNTGAGPVALLNAQTNAPGLTISGINDTGGAISVSNTGGVNAGLIVAGPINAGANAVTLTAGASLGQSVGAVITGGLLMTSSATGTTLNGATNAVTSFSGTNTGVGVINLLDSTPTLTVGAVTDSTASSGPVTINNSGGAVNLTGTINAGANAVNLTTQATAALTQSAAAATTAGLLTLTAGSIGTAAQSVVVGSTTLAANTTTGPNGNQYLAASGTTGVSAAGALNAGTGTINVTGGTFTDAFANGISSPTTVSGGTLLVNTPGTLTSAITVSGTGTLGGTGSVGAITSTGGTVNPGSPVASVGILTATGANFSAGGHLTLEIAAPTTAGSGYDQLNLGTGTLTLGGTSSLTLDLAGLTGAGVITNTIVCNSIVGTFATVNVINSGGYSALLSYGANSITITLYVQVATTITATSGSGQSTTVNSAFASSLVATVLDQHGQPMSGLTVTFTAPSSGASLSVTTFSGATNASGQLTDPITANTHAGSYTVNATVAGVGTPAAFNLTNNPGAATSIVVGSGSPQNVTVNTAFAPLVATVYDTFLNPVPNVSVTFTAPASGATGIFSNSAHTITANTNASGQLSEAFTASTVTGSYTVSAAASGVGTPANFSLTNIPGAAFQLVVLTQPSGTATAGVIFGTQPVVAEEDQYGNILTNDSTHTVTAARGTLGSASLLGSNLTVMLMNGIATFSGLYYDRAETMNVGFSTNAGGFSINSTNVVVAVNVPTQIAFGQPPTNLTAGAAVSPAVTVQIEDAYGNVETGISGSALSVAIASGPTTVFAAGSTTTLVENGGVATFSNLVLTKAGTYTLQASDASPAYTTLSGSFVVSPAAASQIFFTTQPTSAGAGAAIGPAVVAQIEDPFGNIETGDNASNLSIGIAAGPQSATFAGGSTTSVVVSGGVATFPTLKLDTAGSYALQVTDSAAPITSAPSNNFVISPGTATQLAFGQQPPNASAGVTLSPGVTVKIEDMYGNVETGDNTSTLNLAVASGPTGGNFTGGSTLSATVNAGVATFSNLTLDTAGAYTLQATDAAPALTSPASLGFVISPNTATQLVFGQQPTSAASDAIINPAVTLKIEDAYGNVESSDYASTVTVTPNGPGGFTPSSTATATVAGGVATFGNLALAVPGSYTLGATSSGGLNSAPSAPISITPNSLHLAFIQQPTTTTAGVAVAPVKVGIYDQTDTLVAADNSDQVTLAILSGPGGFAPGSVTTVTVSGGVATFNSLVFDEAGTYVLTENTPNATGANSSAFQIVAATPTHLAFSVQPAGATAGSAISPGVQVQILDTFGNVATPGTSDTVTLSIASGPGGFASGTTSSVTASAGTAGFSNLILDTAGSYTLLASDSLGLTTMVSSGFVVSPAATAKLVFGQQPVNVVAGVAVSPASTVLIEDTYGNVETGDNSSSVALAISSGPGGFAPGSVTTITVSAGVATFSALYLDTAGTYTLQASDAAAGLSTAPSNNFVVSPAAATQIVFGQQPTNALAGVALGSLVTAKLEDQFGNVETGDNTSNLSIAISTGPTGAVFATGSTATAVVSAGVATFTTLTLDTAGAYNLTVHDASPVLASAASANFVISPNLPAQLIFDQQPTNALAGNVLSPPVSVEIEDAYGNVETGDNSSVLNLIIASGPAGAAFAGGSTTSATVSGGIATFSTLQLDTAGTYTLQAQNVASLLTSGASSSFTISPNAPNKVVFGQQPVDFSAGDPLNPPVTVQVEDAYGNVETADSSSVVTLGIASGPAGGTFADGNTATVQDGVATFHNLIFDTAGTYVLSESTATLTGANSSSFQIAGAAPVHLAFSVEPGTAVAGTTVNPGVQVDLLDAYGNITSAGGADEVTLTIASGPGAFAVGTVSATVSSAGVANFSSLIFDTAGVYTLRASDGLGLPTTLSTSFVISPASAVQLVFGQQPTTVTAGTAFNPAVSVKIEDAYGNVETGDNTSSVALAIASGPGTFAAGSTTTVTVSAGVATFSALDLDTAGIYSLQASDPAPALTTTPSNPFTVIPGAPTQIVFGQQPTNGVAGVALAPTVTAEIEDQYGNVETADSASILSAAIHSGPAGGVFASGSSVSAVVSNGVATFTTLSLDTAGVYTLVVSDVATGLSGPVSPSFVISPNSATQLVFGQQPTSATAGNALNPHVTVQIEDAFGNVETGDNTSSLSMAIASGPAGATLASGSTVSVTVVGGVATFTTLQLDTAGTYTLQAHDAAPFLTVASGSFTITPSSAAQVVFGQQPTSTFAGTALSPAVTAKIEDVFGNVETADNASSVILGIASGPTGAAFTGGSTVTATVSAGVATFSTLILDTDGIYSLSASTPGGLTGPASTAFQIRPAASGLHLAFGSVPASAVAGSALSPAFTVSILDGLNNVVSTDNTDQVTLNIASGPGGFDASSTITATAVNGVATFSNIVLDTAGAYLLGVSATGGLTGLDSSSITVNPAAATHLAFSQQPTSTSVGQAINPSVVVTLLDAYNNVVTSDNTDQVTIGVASGPGGLAAGSTTLATASAGVAVFNNLKVDSAGSYTLSVATTGGLTGLPSSSFQVSSIGGSQLAFGTLPGSAVAGVALNPPLTVRVVDAFGNLVGGDSSGQVTLSIASGPGGFTGTSSTTAAVIDGIATFNNLTLDTAGNYTFSATATGGLTGPASGALAVLPAAATHLAFGQQPGTATAGAAINPAVTVLILDAFNNVVTTDNTDPVTLSVAGGPGGFTPPSTTTVTAVAGVATFSNLVLDTAGNYTLSEKASGGLSGANSASFPVTPAAASQLLFTQQPGQAIAGAAPASAVTVSIADPFGNVLIGDNSDQVTLSVASGPASFAAGSTTTATVSAGVATFNNLVLDTAGAYTFSASTSGGLGGPASNGFTVSPGAAAQIVFGQQPTSATAGATLNSAVTASIEDQYGNVETADNASRLTLAIASGPVGATFAAGSTVDAIVVEGVATFPTLLFDTAGAYKLTANDASPVLVSAPSSGFVISPAAAAKSVFAQQPTSTSAGVALSPAVTVRIEDQYGNVETGDSASELNLTIATGPASANFAAGSSTSVTVSSGVATFAPLTLDTAGAYTLGVTDATPSVTGASSNSFTISPTSATQLAFGQQPTAATAGAILNPSVTVRILDAYGNLVTTSSISVGVAVVSGTGGITGTTTETASGGVATFSNLALDIAGNYTLSESATGGLTGPNSNSFPVTPAAATHLAFGVEPGDTVAGQAVNPVVTVRVLDQFNNLVTSDNSDQITLAVASGPGSLAGTTPVTATVSSGIATFSNLVLDTAGSYTLSESGTGGLTGAVSSSFKITPAAAANLAFGQQPSATSAGSAINPAVTVRVFDAFGNLVTTDNTDQVTLAVTTGPAGFASSSTTTATVSAGIATFNNLVLDSAGIYTLGESATGGLSGPASTSFQVNPATPSVLAFGTQPSTASAGVAINPAVTVRILDAYGNLVTTDSTSQVTLAVATGPAGFASSSTTTAIASGGVATFGNLVLDAAGAYTLSLSASGGLIGPASSSFQVTPAAANHLAFSQQPASSVAGTALSPAVTVEVLDAYNNLVTTDNSDRVTLAVAGGPAGFTGTSTVTATASAGVATFSNLVLDTAGVYTLSEAGIGNLAGLNSVSFQVTPASANHLAFIQQPGTTKAGVAVSAVTVCLFDAFNNLVTSDNSDQVSLTIASGPGPFASGSATTATASGGVATFSNLLFDTAGSYSLNESATGGLTGSASSTFAVLPNAAAQLVFGQQPTSSTAGVALSPAVAVKIEDRYGNVETLDNASILSLAIATGPTGAAFAGGSSTTATVAAGVATFPSVTLDTAGVYQLIAQDAAPALSSAASASFTIAPNTAAKLVFGQQPSNTQAGAVIGPAVTVQVEDQYGNVETADHASVVSLTIGAGPAGAGFTAGGTVSATVSAGVASFATLTLDTAGAYTLAASDAAPLVTGASSSGFVVNPGGAAQLAFGQQPTATSVAAAIAPSVTVRLLDAFGNLVTTDNSDVVTIGVATGPGALSGTTTATASGGIATFGSLALTTAGSYALSESATGGLTGANSNSFPVAANTPTHLAFGVEPGNTVAGQAVNPVVTVRLLDQFNNLVTSDNTDQVTLAIASGPGALAGTTLMTVSVVNGVATFNNLVLDTAGSYTLSEVATGGLAGPASSSFVITPAAASKLVFGQQPTTTAAGQALNPAVTVRLLDPFNNLVTSDSSDPVTVSIGGGPGAFAAGSSTTVTVSGGIATFSNLILDTAGSYTLDANAAGGQTGTASTAFQVTPLAPTQIAFGTPPSTTSAGVAVNPAVTVQLLDSFGNLVTSDNNGQVALAIAGGPGNFAASSMTTASVSGGTATFSNLVLDTAGIYSLSAVATGGLTGPSSAAFQVTPADPDHVVFALQPSNSIAGVTINPAVSVRIVDAFGNVVTSDSSDQVTLAIAGGPAGFTASSTTTVTAAAGVATFNNLVLDSAGAYVLNESGTDGLSGLSSNSFQITPAAANHLAFAAQPGATTAGAVINPAVTVRVLDAFNNLVSNDSSDQVSLAIASGPGAFAGASTTTVKASNGIATFSNLVLDTAGSYVLGESAVGGLTGPASTTFTVTPSSATRVVFGQQPSSATAGVALASAVTALIEDQFGNVETGNSTSTLSLAISTGPAGAAFTSDSNAIATVADGVATFTTLKFDTAGVYALTASDAPLTSAISSNFTISPNVATQVAFAQQPTNGVAGVALDPVTVLIEDRFGNVETGDNASTLGLAIVNGPAGSSFAAGSTPSMTVTAGAATFGMLLLDTAGAYTLSASDVGAAVPTIDSKSFAISPNNAAQIAFGVQPATSTAGSAIAPAVTVRILDAFNNLVTSDNVDIVTLGIAGGPGGFTAASSTTAQASGGIATFSNLVLDTAGSYALSETSTSGLAGAHSASFQVVAAAPTHLAFSVEPGETTAGVAVNSPVAVSVLDQFNNVVSADQSDRVTLAVASGPGGFTPASSTTAQVNNGVATFGNLVLDTAGTYELAASGAGGLTGGVSSPFQIDPAAPAHLAFGQQPTTAVINTAISPAVTVRILDQFNNLVTDDNTDSVSIALATGFGAFAAGSSTTAAASGGIATFSNLSINAAGANDSLQASSPGLGAVTSTVFGVREAVSSISAVSELNPSVFGQTVNLSVAVAGSGATPGGTVTISEGSNTLATAMLNAGAAMIPLNNLGAGAGQTLTVSYSGDGLYLPSTSTLQQSVTKAGTMIALTGTGSSIYGQAANLTANVAVLSPGAGNLSGGSVTFMDGSTTLGISPLDGFGQATLTTTSLNVGSHSITAVYDGTSNLASSTSSAGTQIVSIASTTTTLTKLTSAYFGQAITLTATVLASSGVPAAGTVTFMNGKKVIGSGALNAQGIATFTTGPTQLPTNATTGYSITAVYGATGNFSGSTSAAQAQLVTPDPVQIALTSSSPGQSIISQPVTFAATLTPAAPGAGTPTGSVSFYDNGKFIVGVPVNSAGVASITDRSLALGTHTITATYSGATNFAAGTTTLQQAVSPIATTMSLESSLSGGSVYAQAVTFSAVIADASIVASKLSGKVSFYDNGTLLGTASVSANGLATFTTSSLTGSTTHNITAVYGGTATLAGATAALPQAVAAAATTETLIAPPGSYWATGVPIAFTAKVAAAKGIKVTGSVTFVIDDLPQAPVMLSAGSATFSYTFTGTGPHTVSFNYNPNTPNLAGGPSSQITQDALDASNVALSASTLAPTPANPVTVTATVTGAAGIPTGQVSFYDGKKYLGTVDLSADGAAALTLTNLAVGGHSITATYLGDENYLPKTSSPLALGERLV